MYETRPPKRVVFALGVALSSVVILLAAAACRGADEPGTSSLADHALPVQPQAPAQLPVPDIVDAVEPSIVRVTAQYPDRSGTASGLVYSAEGHILTNWHVVEGASRIDVQLNSAIELPATLIREDPNTDVAMLKVKADGLQAAEFGDSDALRVGEDVISIGHSLGFGGGPSVSRGIISGLDRTVADANGRLLASLIQTDAAIDQGSSGGALVNSEGKIIGLNVGLSATGQGANFALASNTAVASADLLVQLGKRPAPGYLGVGGVDVTPRLARVLQLPVESGFGVSSETR